MIAAGRASPGFAVRSRLDKAQEITI